MTPLPIYFSSVVSCNAHIGTATTFPAPAQYLHSLARLFKGMDGAARLSGQGGLPTPHAPEQRTKERDKEREKETERKSEKERKRARERERAKECDRGRKSERERERDRERESEKD